MNQVAVTFRFQNKIAPYADALRSVGVDPVLVNPDSPIDSLHGRGLMLTGGTDLDPALYGAEPREGVDQPDRERDAMEHRLLREALAADLPVLAICRGMQLFNVAHGGTLLQHIDGHRVPLHEVTVHAGTRLAAILGGGSRQVNSRHHQAAERVGNQLVVAARAADGIIEGLERADRRFAVAVQWHPEDIFAQEKALFESFAEAL